MFGVQQKVLEKVADKGTQVLRDIDENLGRIQRNFQEVVTELDAVKKELQNVNARLKSLEEKR